MVAPLLCCLTWLTPTPQVRYGVWALPPYTVSARPVADLTREVTDLEVVGKRAFVWAPGDGAWALELGRDRARKIAGVPGRVRTGAGWNLSVADLSAAGDGLLVATNVAGIWQVPPTGTRASRVKGVPRRLEGEIIVQRARGRALLGTVRDGLYALEDRGSAAVRVSGLPGEASVTVLAYAKGSTWIGTRRDGLWRLADGAWRAVPVAGPVGGVTGIAPLGDGVVARSTTKALWLVQANGVTKLDQPTEVRAVHALRPGKSALIESSDLMWRLDAGSSQPVPLIGFETAKPPVGLDDLRLIDGVAVDSRGIWVWNVVELRLYDVERSGILEPVGLPGEITCVLVGDFDVFVGTYQNGLWAVDKRTLTVRRIPGAYGPCISDLAMMDGTLLIATRQGMPH